MSAPLSPASDNPFLGGQGGGESRKLRICPAPFKSSPLPFKREEPALPIKVGGEVAPFPLRHPFRFHARRFPKSPPSGPSPHPTPPVSHLRSGPGERAETQRPPAGADGKAEPRRRRCRSGGRGGGRGRAPSQRSPARGTQPLSAAARAHKHRRRRRCVTTPRAPKPHPRPSHWLLALAGLSRASRARGILGVVVL